jgi:hypothetical protein
MINEVLGTGWADDGWGEFPIAYPGGHHEKGEICYVIEVKM